MLARLRTTFELQDPRHARMLPMEGLRGVAVLLVFLQHYTVQSQSLGLGGGFTATLAGGLRWYGNFGVELFFVLSGFLIYGTLLRKAPPFLSFMARRVERLYPTFLAVFALALALALTLPGAAKLPADPWAAALYLAANLAMLPGLFPVGRLVEVAWSLSYEMFFYLATAAAVMGLGLGRLRAGWRVAILLALTGLFIAVSRLGLPGFPIRMLPFFAGMLLAEASVARLLARRLPAWTGWAAPLACVAFCGATALQSETAELLQTVAFFLLCAVAFRNAGLISRLLCWAPLRWLGNMSYSYYLIHGFVVRVIMLALARTLPGGLAGGSAGGSAGGLADWQFWALLPAILAITLAVGGLLFALVEKPLSLRPARTAPRYRTEPGRLAAAA